MRPAHADDLGAIREEAFRLLARGVADRRSACHTPCLATIGLDGAPRLRSVVLRGFAAADRRLRLHTDIRSAKCQEIRANPRAAVHVYDPGGQFQLRLAGLARLHHGDAEAAAAWAGSASHSRACYAILPGPGTPVPLPPAAPPADDSGAPHFAVIGFTFESLEWLWLNRAGHRRARFVWEGADGHAEWLVP